MTEVEKKGFDKGFWSKEGIKDVFLEEQREYLWNMDHFRNVLVPLLGLKNGSLILDVGCGLGFLGLNLVKLVPNGKLIGVDLDEKLVEEASRRVEEIGFKEADFRVGNAYELPLEDDTCDLSICQTLLMHLDEPMKAIREMRRVTKKGEKVVAIEPDYSSLSFFDTVYETLGFSVEQRVKLWRWDRILAVGKKKLGRGDNEIGSKVPYLFFKSGLRVVDVRGFDKAFYLIPPYHGHELEMKHLLMPPEKYIQTLDLQTEFLAGGGTKKEWDKYLSQLKRVHVIRQKQVEEQEYVGLTMQAATITIAEKP